MSIRFALIIAATVFVVTLVARLPARALTALLPAGISCDAAAGTIWRGSCGQLRSGTAAVAGFGWTLHPAALLHLALSADLTSDDPRTTGRAAVELSRGGGLQIHALSAQLALQNDWKLLPHGLAGNVQVAVSEARIEQGRLTSLTGSLRILQLHSDSLAADLGSFEMRFPDVPAGDPIAGELRDLGGPLSVQAQLRLTRAGAYDLSGWVMAREQADPKLVQTLQLLGSPDAQGRRMFSLSGSL